MHTVCDGHNKTTQTFKQVSPASPLETTAFTAMSLMTTTIIATTWALSADCLWRQATWVTHRWGRTGCSCLSSEFARIIRICKVNTYLAIKAFDHWLGWKLPFFEKEACQVPHQQPFLCAWVEGNEEVEGSREWTSQPRTLECAGVCTLLDRRVVGHFKQNKVSSVSLHAETGSALIAPVTEEAGCAGPVTYIRNGRFMGARNFCVKIDGISVCGTPIFCKIHGIPCFFELNLCKMPLFMCKFARNLSEWVQVWEASHTNCVRRFMHVLSAEDMKWWEKTTILLVGWQE